MRESERKRLFGLSFLRQMATAGVLLTEVGIALAQTNPLPLEHDLSRLYRWQ
jgi:hypothetical protein